MPVKPPAPIYQSSTSSTTTLVFLNPSDAGGSPVNGFKLYYDTLQLEDNYKLIYSGMSQTVTVSTTDGL